VSIGKTILSVLALAIAASAETGPERGTPQWYTITDLGTLGGWSSVAHGVNDHGQVAGGADMPDGRRHAYFWEDGVMTDLGVHPQHTQSEAHDINNLGQVVGFSQGSTAFLWSGGEMMHLGHLSGLPWGNTVATAINDAGQIVGSSYDGTETHAFLWEDGVMTDLGTLGGPYSLAWAINAIGQVVGESWTESATHAFFWENGTMSDMGTLGGGTSRAFGINNLGRAVGTAGNADFDLSAFLWQNGVMTDLGALGGFSHSRAKAINVCGQVVLTGSRDVDGDDGLESVGYAFLYDPKEGIIDLADLLPPDSGWSDFNPRDISDFGHIVGAGSINGRRHAFLMTPPGDADTDGDGVLNCMDMCDGIDDALFAPHCVDEIPTVSQWGLAVMTLLLLVTGKIYFARRAAMR